MRYFTSLLLLLFSFHSFARYGESSHDYKFRIYLNDKGPTQYSVTHPSAFLSERSIARKERQQAVIDASDFPICGDYFTLVEKAGGRVVTFSKWFRTMVVQVPDSALIDAVQTLPFVDSVKYVWKGEDRLFPDRMRPRLHSLCCPVQFVDTVFGLTQKQFRLHDAEKMYHAGFRGKGIVIGVIDAGFTNFDVMPCFRGIRLEGYRNFVPGGEIFSSSDHGTRVLSTMAVRQEGWMMGSASEASYWLLRSEDAASEFPVEEDYWVRAVEVADSLGVDLINTSLGYNQFDDRTLNYSHRDLTGRKSLISMAADKAFEKGMLVVVSAGNSGNKQWGKTTAPGDAHHAITVGAVGIDSLIAPFSSRGYTADGRIKPDLVSIGQNTVTIGGDGAIGMVNGTSFSAPFFAGMMAALWSVDPSLHRSQLIERVKHASDRFARPDSIYGNGIPDFGQAMEKMLADLTLSGDTVTEPDFSLSRMAKDSFLFTLSLPGTPPSFCEVLLLDQSANPVSQTQFEEASLKVVLPTGFGEQNAFFYFVLRTPERQKTCRFRW